MPYKCRYSIQAGTNRETTPEWATKFHNFLYSIECTTRNRNTWKKANKINAISCSLKWMLPNHSGLVFHGRLKLNYCVWLQTGAICPQMPFSTTISHSSQAHSLKRNISLKFIYSRCATCILIWTNLPQYDLLSWKGVTQIKLGFSVWSMNIFS